MSPSINDVDPGQWDLPEDLKELRNGVSTPEEGFFGPESLYWKIGRENILFLGGPSAILLQLAHPQVAAGVSDHSDFYHDPVGRLERTFKIIHRVVFGSLDEALNAAHRVRLVHEAVRGELPEDVGSYDAGTDYEANRPDLLLWVHATLVDQTLLGYERYVGPLDRGTKRDYYEESKLFARLFGIPRETIPDTYSDFRDYYTEILETTLATGRQGRKLKKQLFSRNRFTGLPALFFASAMMPEPAREVFGLPWNGLLETLDRGVCAAIRPLTHSLPPELRYVKKYRHRMMNLGHSDSMQSSVGAVLEALRAFKTRLEDCVPVERIGGPAGT